MSKEMLKNIISKEWGINDIIIDMDTSLITLAEKIAMESENCTRDECYQMYIDNPSLHLPGLISFYIVDELGITSKNVNGNMTINEILTLKDLEK